MVDVFGKVESPELPVDSVSQKYVEVHVSRLFVVAQAIPKLPLELEAAARPEHEIEARKKEIAELEARIKEQQHKVTVAGL